jgi:hypothetical protein
LTATPICSGSWLATLVQVPGVPAVVHTHIAPVLSANISSAFHVPAAGAPLTVAPPTSLAAAPELCADPAAARIADWTLPKAAAPLMMVA